MGFIWFQNLWFQDICIQIFDSYQSLDRWFQKLCRQTLDSNDIWLQTPNSRMPDYRRVITWHMTTVPIPDTWFQDIWFQDLWFQIQFRTFDSKTCDSKTNSGHLIPRLLIPKPIPDIWLLDLRFQNQLWTLDSSMSFQWLQNQFWTPDSKTFDSKVNCGFEIPVLILDILISTW